MTEVLEKLITQAVDIYDFRAAKLGDIEAVVALYKGYFDESYLPEQGLIYAPQRAWARLFSDISKGDVPHLLAVVKATNEMVGVIAYNINHDFTEQPFANLDKFYVRPRWRKSPVGRILLTLCLEIARADGATVFNASLNSGMLETASARNLFIKLGFDPLDGVVLVRRLSDG